MRLKILVCVLSMSVIALALLALRQARIVQVNRMNRAWRALQYEQDAWDRLRLDIAQAARPELLRPDDRTEHWTAALDRLGIHLTP